MSGTAAPSGTAKKSGQANTSAVRDATTTEPEAVPRPVIQVTRRALRELRKGASVEIWVASEPYTIEAAGETRVERQVMLGFIAIALISHFSPRCKRELHWDRGARVRVPFTKEPTKLLVAWMMAGGGDQLGTPEIPYPRKDLKKLGILKNLAMHLEIDSLVELIDRDIVAATPLPKPPAEEKLCWFCNKPGHTWRNCRERYAVHVHRTPGETISMRSTVPAATVASVSTSKKSAPTPAVAASTSGKSAPAPAVKTSTPKTTASAPSSTVESSTGSTKVKLIMSSGQLLAHDASGWSYRIDHRGLELEIDWPGKPGWCKVRGKARVESW